MNVALEVVVNDPFQARLIKHLYSDKNDLKLASPNAKFPFCEDEWEADFATDPENSSLIFKHQGLVIGHVAFLPKAEDIFICYVILLPEYRGKNIAQDMMNHAEEFCRLNYPHQELHLNVNKKNTRAMKLYERLDYVTCAEMDDKFRMVKRLKG